MIVLSVTNCPMKLRGDLSKWLLEISPGVYVGNLNRRIREALWERVCAYIDSGRATLVYSINNEQGLDFYTYNSNWESVDYDGIHLVEHPKSGSNKQIVATNKTLSDAKKWQIIKNKAKSNEEYIILDIETTGLNVNKDTIVEIGALLIKNNQISNSCSRLISSNAMLTKKIIQLTGITKESIDENGVPQGEALNDFMEFIGRRTVYGYNVSFDLCFIQKACICEQVKFTIENFVDIKQIAHAKLNLLNYSLIEVANKLGIYDEQHHRALDDCNLTYKVLTKLNEFSP